MQKWKSNRHRQNGVGWWKSRGADQERTEDERLRLMRLKERKRKRKMYIKEVWVHWKTAKRGGNENVVLLEEMQLSSVQVTVAEKD